MAFPSQVNVQQNYGVAGSYCDTNPHATVDAPAGGAFVAGSNGCTVGAFAWADTVTGTTLSNAGSTTPTGFIGNKQNALITTYLANASLVVPAGQPVVCYSTGGFWAKHTGSSAVTVGMKAYASTTTGLVQFAATGATISGYIETKWYAATTAAAGEMVKMTTWI